MLRTDPIIARFPDHLPTEEEVELTRELLQRPENKTLLKQVCDDVVIAGCLTSTLERFACRAREDKFYGPDCAPRAVELLQQSLAARERCLVNTCFLNTDNLFSREFRDQFHSVMQLSHHGEDKYGHPVTIFRVGLVNMEHLDDLWERGEQLQATHGLALNGVTLFLVRVMEYTSKVASVEASQKIGSVADRRTMILDCGDKLAKVHHPSFMKTMREFSAEIKLMQPEVIHCIIVVNLTRLMYTLGVPLVRMFARPLTMQKFKFASAHNSRSQLLEYVDESNLPPYLGGSCSCAECMSVAAGGNLRGGTFWEWDECHYCHDASQGAAGVSASPARGTAAAAADTCAKRGSISPGSQGSTQQAPPGAGPPVASPKSTKISTAPPEKRAAVAAQFWFIVGSVMLGILTGSLFAFVKKRQRRR